MVRTVLRFELARPVPQFPAPRGELVYRRVADPADLERLAVGPEHAPQAELLQLLGEEPVGQRAHPQLVAEQRVAVQRPPPVVCSVRALRPVGDRVVDVQLRMPSRASCCSKLATMNPSASRHSPEVAEWCPVRTYASSRSATAIIRSLARFTAPRTCAARCANRSASASRPSAAASAEAARSDAQSTDTDLGAENV